MSLDLLDTLSTKFTELSPSMSFPKMRQQAFDSLQAQGLPTRKTEAYKYTPITQAISKEVSLDLQSPEATSTPTALPSSSLEGIDTYNLLLIDGNMAPQSSLPEVDKVQVYTLQEGYSQHQDTFEQYFSKLSHLPSDPYFDLNTAFFNGIFIHIKEGAQLEKPIFIRNYVSQGNSLSCPRVFILADKGCKAALYTSYGQLGKATCFVNDVTEVALKESAQIDHYTLQHDLPEMYHVHHTHFIQEKYSQLRKYTFTASGKMVRNNLHITLDSPETEAYMYGLYCPTGKQHVDNHTTVDHRAPHTYSNELYKGILSDRSKGVFNGRIFVRQEAQKTNAFQSNNNLVLSDQAVINTKPQLEIWADDVKCSHGATTGQLDESQLFYLQARGIPKPLAQQMLLKAFALEVLEKVPDQKVAQLLERQLFLTNF